MAKSKIQKVIERPEKILIHLLMWKPLSRLFDDRKYIEILYKLCVRRKIDLDNPQSFNEKLNWLKLYYHDPIQSKLVDKYDAKAYVKEKIGEAYVVPCYGVWNNPEDIDFDSLPNQFVLKCTHNSGTGMCICKDKSKLDIEMVKKGLNKGLKERFYLKAREWAYKNATPRIIADKFLDDHSGKELRDYKFFCFNGVPRTVYISNKGADVTENYYDMDFNPLEINHDFPKHHPEYVKPKSFELMKELAGKLSEGFPHVRIDFFDVDGHVYFAEFAFYDWAGLTPFHPYETDLMLGNYITLPEKRI